MFITVFQTISIKFDDRKLKTNRQIKHCRMKNIEIFYVNLLQNIKRKK